ncbi:MAG: hypothetical protein IJR99_06325 [Kiritimatiellae bacterium]|nr:hypothetical protein [Kiritimatiellia bacterium]
MTLPVVAFLTFSTCAATTYYVDSLRGSDSATGRSVFAAWKSVEAVQRADLQPGDTVLFHRDRYWMGTFRAKDGVTYSAYGGGNSPAFANFVPQPDPRQWESRGNGVWMTRPIFPVLEEQRVDLLDSRWEFPAPAGTNELVRRAMELRHEEECWFNRIFIRPDGNARTNLVFTGPAIEELFDTMLLRIRVRSSVPVIWSGAVTVVRGAAKTPVMRSIPLMKKERTLDSDWQTLYILLQLIPGVKDNGHLQFSTSVESPRPFLFDFEPVGLWNVRFRTNLARTQSLTAIQLGQQFGTRKPKREELTQPGDFYLDAEAGQVFVRCDVSPAQEYHPIAFVFGDRVISTENVKNCRIEGLSFHLLNPSGKVEPLPDLFRGCETTAIPILPPAAK